jgi:hypothetical protein
MKRTVTVYRYSVIISMLATVLQRLSVILIFGRGFGSSHCPIDMEISTSVSAVSSQNTSVDALALLSVLIQYNKNDLLDEVFVPVEFETWQKKGHLRYSLFWNVIDPKRRRPQYTAVKP